MTVDDCVAMALLQGRLPLGHCSWLVQQIRYPQFSNALGLVRLLTSSGIPFTELVRLSS
jgi:hypothetical protein